jgi:hypothetical protein
MSSPDDRVAFRWQSARKPHIFPAKREFPAVKPTANDGPNLIEPAAAQQQPVPPAANRGASAPSRRARKKDARQQSLF